MSTLQNVEMELLILKNNHDLALERYRNEDILELEKQRYSMSDNDYMNKYNAIFASYEPKFYRSWLTK